MSIACLAQAEQQQQLEWLGGGTISILLDSAATNGQLLVARSYTSEGAASPYHLHTRDDEVFMMGWALTPERLVEGAKMAGNVVLGPPR